MLSKLATVALIGHASALTTGTTACNTGFSCHQCVKNNCKWCMPTADMFGTAGEESGGCTTLDVACEDAVDGTSHTSLRIYSNKDVELAACINLSGKCGDDRVLSIDSDTPLTIEVDDALDANDKCSYLVKSTVGPPIYKYTGTDPTNLEISYVQYTGDDRVTMETQAGITDYPSADSTESFVDQSTYCDTNTCTNGTPLYFPRTAVVSGMASNVEFDDIKAAIVAYNTNVATYEAEVAAVKDNNEGIRELNWWELAFGFKQEAYEQFPTYIGEYEGLSMDNTLSQGGYGYPTSGILKLETANNYYLTWGMGSTSTGTEQSIDTNKVTSEPRYLIINYIATTASVDAADAIGTVSIGTFNTDDMTYMTSPNAPEEPKDLALLLKAGLAALVVAFSLF